MDWYQCLSQRDLGLNKKMGELATKIWAILGFQMKKLEILGNFGNDHYFPVVVAIILFTLTWKDPQFDEEMDVHDFFGMDR